jgi:hypothetical protein
VQQQRGLDTLMCGVTGDIARDAPDDLTSRTYLIRGVTPLALQE